MQNKLLANSSVIYAFSNNTANILFNMQPWAVMLLGDFSQRKCLRWYFLEEGHDIWGFLRDIFRLTFS